MSDGSNYRVLIVEDNEMNMALIREILSINGYETFESYDGVDGVEKTIHLLPDLVLMDVNLPEMDGMTAMKMIKNEESTKSIPIIALTASAMKGEEDKFIAEGFDGYVAKPVTMKELLEEVEEKIGNK